MVCISAFGVEQVQVIVRCGLPMPHQAVRHDRRFEASDLGHGQVMAVAVAVAVAVPVAVAPIGVAVALENYVLAAGATLLGLIVLRVVFWGERRLESGRRKDEESN